MSTSSAQNHVDVALGDTVSAGLGSPRGMVGLDDLSFPTQVIPWLCPGLQRVQLLIPNPGTKNHPTAPKPRPNCKTGGATLASRARKHLFFWQEERDTNLELGEEGARSCCSAGAINHMCNEDGKPRSWGGQTQGEAVTPSPHRAGGSDHGPDPSAEPPRVDPDHRVPSSPQRRCCSATSK